MKKYPVIIIFLITMLLVCGETVMAKERLGKPLGVLANGVEDRVVISWEPVKKADGYEVFEKAKVESVYKGKSNEKEEDRFKEKSTRQKVSIQSKGISNEKEGHLRKVREKGGDDDSNGFNIYY